MSTITASPIEQAIPWLDTFQRSRNVEGDLISLGRSDVTGVVGSLARQGERFVIIDSMNGLDISVLSRCFRKAEIILINEDPLDAVATEAMELERDGYRIVAINDCQGKWDTHVLLAQAEALVVTAGLVLVSPWFNEEEEGAGEKAGYWQYMRSAETPLIRCGHVGSTLLLTKQRIWQKDYEAVLDGLHRRES